MKDPLLPTRPRVTTELLAAAERTLNETARAEVKRIWAERIERDSTIALALAPVKDAEANEARLVAYREQLVERLRAEPELLKEIETTDEEIERLRRSVRLFRESASKLPRSSSLNAELAEAEKLVAEREAVIVGLQHQQAMEVLADAFAAIERDIVPKVLLTQQEFEIAWHKAHGEWPFGEPAVMTHMTAARRVSRFVSWWVKDLFGQHGHFISNAWPRESASLFREMYARLPFPAAAAAGAEPARSNDAAAQTEQPEETV